MRRAQPAVPATPLPRRFAPLLLTIFVTTLAAAPASASASAVSELPASAEAVPARALSGVAVEGGDRVVVRLPEAPSDARVADGQENGQAAPGLAGYENAGYSLRLGDGSTAGDGTAVVEVELGPLESGAPFQLPALEEDADGGAGEGAEPSGLAALAREITGKSVTLYGAVSSVLGWVVHNVVTDETAALVPAADGGEEGEGGGDVGPRSQEPVAVVARGSGDAGGIAGLTVALLRSVGIEARVVRGRVVGTPEVGEPWGPHTWVEVRYPDAGWVFSDPLHHHHYVPATYLRLPPLPEEPSLRDGPPEPAGAEATGRPTLSPTLPAPAPPYELLERRDRRQVVDLYSPGAPGVTARRNRAVQRAGALRVVVAGPRRGSAVLEGADGRTSKILIDGESVFVGLATGSYRLEVYLEDEAPIVRQLELGPRERRAIFLRHEAEAAEREPAGKGGRRDLPPPDHYRARQPTTSRNTP